MEIGEVNVVVLYREWECGRGSGIGLGLVGYVKNAVDRKCQA